MRRTSSKSPLTPISHEKSRKDMQDGALDLFSPGREHCQNDKESPGEGKDDATGCKSFPRECEKWGLKGNLRSKKREGQS